MFDNISKFLAEQFSVDFATWLIGEPVALTELSPSELSLEPIRVDALILRQLDKDVIRRLLRRELMRESVVYQELLEEIHERVNQESKQSKVKLILRLLVRRLKQAVPSTAEARIRALEVEQLDLLVEALMDFESLADLEAWLASQAEGLGQ